MAIFAEVPLWFSLRPPMRMHGRPLCSALVLSLFPTPPSEVTDRNLTKLWWMLESPPHLKIDVQNFVAPPLKRGVQNMPTFRGVLRLRLKHAYIRKEMRYGRIEKVVFNYTKGPLHSPKIWRTLAHTRLTLTACTRRAERPAYCN